MGNISFERKIMFSQMFFYHRVYLNGKQILLDNLENLYQILDELHQKGLFEIKDIYSPKNVKKIFGKLLPEDCELLNTNDKEKMGNPQDSVYQYFNILYNQSFPIYNFYSPSLDTKIDKETSLFKVSHLKILEECKNLKFWNINHQKKWKKMLIHLLKIKIKKILQKNCIQL